MHHGAENCAVVFDDTCGLIVHDGPGDGGLFDLGGRLALHQRAFAEESLDLLSQFVGDDSAGLAQRLAQLNRAECRLMCGFGSASAHTEEKKCDDRSEDAGVKSELRCHGEAALLTMASRSEYLEMICVRVAAVSAGREQLKQGALTAFESEFLGNAEVPCG